jgi:hypothetical protein
MSELLLLQRARQGNPTAIATLINRQLQPNGLSATVQRTRTMMRVEITAQQMPSRKLLAYLHKAFQKLQPQGIEQVKILIQPIDQAIVWEDTIHLSRVAPVAPAPRLPSAPVDVKPSAKCIYSPVWDGLSFWANWIAASLGAIIVMVVLVSVFIWGIVAVSLPKDSLANWFNPRGLGELSFYTPTLFLQFFLFFAMVGLIIGDAQTVILRRRLLGIRGWRWATAMGVPMSLVVGDLSYAIARAALHNRALLSWLAWGLSLMLGSIILALCQWTVLRRRIVGFWVWVLGHALSVPLAIAISMGLGIIIEQIAAPLLPPGSQVIQEAVVSVTVVLLLWLSMHSVIGAVLAWLLRQQSSFPAKS